MASTAYTRPSKPTPAADRRQPKIVKNLSRIEPKKLGLGLAAGCCLALLTYISLAKLFSIYTPVFDTSTLKVSTMTPGLVTVETQEEDPNTAQDLPKQPDTAEIREPAFHKEPVAPVTKDEETPKTIPNLYSGNDDAKSATRHVERRQLENKVACDDQSVDEGFPYARPVVCEMAGDIRICPKERTVFFVSPSSDQDAFDTNGERKVRPYARKDDFLLPSVVEVTVKSVSTEREARQCTKRYSVPAVIFSVAGYTGNFFHDMTDVLIPLFLTSSHFNGEVQLFITNYKPWWVQRFQPVLRKLSNYDVINFDDDEGVHCFPHGFLGLIRDRDLIIYPHATRNPRNYSMVDFTRFLRGAYSLKKHAPLVLGEDSGKRPRMLIIKRAGTRKLLNLEEVKGMAEDMGFEVVVAEAGPDIKEFAEIVNSCDVLLAVHGAGLTNQIFLPTQAVLIQVVPWGKMDWMATNFYGQPARDMNLRYLEYYVNEEETSLKDKFPRDHMVFKDPYAIHMQGWKALAEIIMTQDVMLNLWRFRPILLQAIDLLQE